MAVTATLPLDPKLKREFGIIKAYQADTPIAEIENKYDAWDDEIYKILKRHNIEPQRRSIPTEIELQIVEAYQGDGKVKDISRNFSVAPGTVYAVLDRHCVDRRNTRYRFKPGAFIPQNGEYTPEQKYWGGSLLMRGAIHIAKGFNPALAVQGSIERLESFKKFLGSNHKIHPCGDNFIVRVLNTSWVSDLAPFGLTPKIRTNRIPAKAFLMDRHYWRGIFDEVGVLEVAEDRSSCSTVFYGKPLACHSFGAVTRRLYPGSIMDCRHTEGGGMAYLRIFGAGAAIVATWLYSGGHYTNKPEHRKIALAMSRFIPADFYDM